MLGESREMGQGMATAVGRALHPGLRPDHWWQVVGGWWQVVGGWWLVAGGWWLVVGGKWLVLGGWWQVVWWQVVGGRWLVVGGWWQVVGTWGPAPASYLQLQVQLLRFLPQLPGCSLPALTRLTGL